MSKRVALPGAIKAIREARAGYDPRTRTYSGDPSFGVGPFATKALLSDSHLCNIEAGRKAVTEEVLHRIAAHLGVPIDAISYITESEAAA